MRPKIGWGYQSQLLVKKLCSTFLSSVTAFCILAGSLHGGEKELGWKSWILSFPRRFCQVWVMYPIFLSQEPVTALSHNVAQESGELFRSSVQPYTSKWGTLIFLIHVFFIT